MLTRSDMRNFLIFIAILAASIHVAAQEKTLRIDYIFSGTDKSVEISLDEMSCFDVWAGRRVNLDKVPVRGNGQISMTDHETGAYLYRQSFSTLFQLTHRYRDLYLFHQANRYQQDDFQPHRMGN